MDHTFAFCILTFDVYMRNYIQPIAKERINTVPTTMGIYIFKRGTTITYIGKSINLKSRLISHFENARIDAKEAAIIQNSDSIEYIIVDSEFKALLLESQLIQQYHPQYNSRWRDDKSYLYIKFTKEEFPKICLTRRENDGKSLYFGPFPSGRIAQEILREIRKVFPFCTQKRITKKPCFYAKIGQCAPCPNDIALETDKEIRSALKKQYRWNIRQIIKVLEGNVDMILKGLYEKINELSAEEKYEEALLLRNKIKRFEYFIQERLFLTADTPSYNQAEESIEALKKLLEPYFENVRDGHDAPQMSKSADQVDTYGVSFRLGRIECYDVSNLSQKQATASMVVLTKGLIDKSQYRRFKIKNEKLQSDFEMMSEIFYRRFRNQKSKIKNQKEKKWPMPDLIVVDGGKPQVRIVRQVLSDLEITIPLIGIAKRPDRFVIGVDGMPSLRPPQTNLGYRLIQSLRDEAHRFARKYHLTLRDKKFLL